MAFTVDDFEALYRILSERPEWRARLRPLILGDEYVQLPERMARVEEQLIRITAALEAIAARMERVDGRLDRIEGRMGNIEGELLEDRYVRNMREWFADVIWPVERVVTGDLPGIGAAIDASALSSEEAAKIRAADILVRGNLRDDAATQVVLVVEISLTVNVEDVERAVERAGLLRLAGYDALAFVGGYRATTDALDRAKELDVIVDLRRPAA